MSLATKKMQQRWNQEIRKSLHPEAIQDEDLDLFSRDGKHPHDGCNVNLCSIKV